MSAEARHRLDGLEPDNLLAFMALLGLLRAIETAEPEWRPRAYWDETRHPLRPVLTLAEAKTQEDVAEAAARGVRSWAGPLGQVGNTAAQLELRRCEEEINIGRSSLSELSGERRKKKEEEIKKLERRIERFAESVDKLTELARSHANFREILGSASAGAEAAWVECLAGEQMKDEDLTVQSSPLKLASGQMPFVGALISLTRDCTVFEIQSSLFGHWEFRHRGESLRLAPAEVRRYAYRASDPTKKETSGRKKRRADNVSEQTGDGVAPSERGANSLAALGHLSMPVFAATRAMLVPGILSDKQDRVIEWPLVLRSRGPGASLTALEALMRFPTHSAMWMRATIIDIEDYKNVTTARPR